MKRTAVDVSSGVEGSEYKTESLHTDGSETTLRRVEQTLEPLRFRWSPDVIIVDGSPVPNDLRTIETKTTLDNGLMSKQTSIDPNDATGKTIGFDKYNNQTDVWEYDFGQGSAGALIRHMHTDFVRRKPDPDGPNIAENYQDDAFIHIRNLPSRVRVYAAGDEVNPRSETKLVYDNYTAGMTDRPNITGHAGAYDASRIRRGNPTKTTQRLLPSTDVSTTMQYDIAGNVVSVTDPRGKTITIDYSDRFGFPDGEARANNQNPLELAGQSTYAFATSGTNPLGHTVYSQFDYYTGTPVNTEDANGVTTKGFYSDLLGRPTLVVSAVGIASLERQTSFTYDDSGRTITTRSDQAFSGDGVLTSTIAYDGLGRTIETRTSDPQGTVFTNQEFDAMGRAKRSFNPHRSTSDETYGYTDTVYDALGRVVQVQTFGGLPPGTSTGVVVSTYLGNTTTVRDQANKQRRSVTDGIGRLKSVDEMLEYPSAAVYATTNYDYDLLGNLVHVAQGGQHRYFMYDSLSRLIRARNPEQDLNSALALPDAVTGNSQWCMSYSYDPNGNLQVKTDPRNITTTYGYDDLNRVTSRTYTSDPQNTPAVFYKYDAQVFPTGAPAGFDRGYPTGRLVATTYGASTSSNGTYMGYDRLGRVTASVQQTNGANYGLGYEYNLAGAMTSETYPSNRVVRTEYDTAGRMAGVKNQATGTYYAGGSATDSLNRVQYASHGAASKMKLGNGKWEHTTFNSRLQPLQIGLGTSTADSSILELDYTYGVLVGATLDATKNSGNIQSQKITVPTTGGGTQVMTQSYTYDAVNRLATANENSGASWSEQFGYDRFGNMWVPSCTGITLSSLTPQSQGAFDPATNRLVLPSQYDSVGNQVTDGQSREFTYDAENRQTKFNTTVGQYFYDGDGRRVKKIDATGTTVFVYNAGGQLISEYTTGTPSGGGTSYLTTDHLGSTRVVTDAQGSVKARHDYLPLGGELNAPIGGRTVAMKYDAADSTKQRFTQKERDSESGLDYFGARYYSSAQGRFTTADPLMASAIVADPQSFNRFIYVQNNPLRYVDPDGLEGQSAWEQLTDEEKRILAPKLTTVKDPNKVTSAELTAAGAAFNARFTGPNAEDTAAIVTAVKNFIDNAGGHTNSDIWQQITFLEKGWAGPNNSAGIAFHVKDTKTFLDVLGKNGFDVDAYYESFNIMADHPHSARFITETSFQPGMHISQEEGYAPTNRFDVHWDPRSAAFRKVNIVYVLPTITNGFPPKELERAHAGLSHNSPLSAAQTREALGRMGIVPRNER